MLLFTVLIILSAVYLIFEPKIKGVIGEKKVAVTLSQLPKQQYKILNDIMLQTEYGTTQIDHIVISIYGIFVIETKNYKGWITGSEYGDYWTKNMYGKKYTFRNPLKQNYAHIKALEKNMALSEDKFIPIVVFLSRSEIKVNTKSDVVYIRQLKMVMEKYKDIKFQESELDMLVKKVQNANITTGIARKAHVEQIRMKEDSNKKKIAAGICPRCAGQLVARKGKYGTFIGCSNYPKCRYTKN